MAQTLTSYILPLTSKRGQCSFMKFKLAISAIVLLAIPVIVLICLQLGLAAPDNHDFNFLSEPFIPVFDDVNEQLSGAFSYKSANYKSGNLGEYYLDYLGADADFTNTSMRFCNMFSSSIADGKHDVTMRGEYIIRIYSSNEFLICWYNIESNLRSVITNKFCDFSEFESLDGIRKLTVVTSKFTEEQREYAKSFQDKCSFEVVFSDNIPW